MLTQFGPGSFCSLRNVTSIGIAIGKEAGHEKTARGRLAILRTRDDLVVDVGSPPRATGNARRLPFANLLRQAAKFVGR